MPVSVPCRCCGTQLITDSVYDALRLTASPAFTNAQRELVAVLCTKGPISLAQIKVMNLDFIGTRVDDLKPVYIRRLCVDINKKLAHLADVIIHTTATAPGASTDNPIAMLYTLPGSELDSLEQMQAHTRLREAIASEDDGGVPSEPGDA